jgi:murein L,D-transpeptidase YafK
MSPGDIASAIRSAVILPWLTLALLPALAAEAPRVERARRSKLPTLKTDLQNSGLEYPPRGVLIRVFKRERVLELWVRARDAGRNRGTFRLFRSYPVCAASGDLGPKRRSGDGQVPEGFYVVNRFNPSSSFHLSLGLNYPNAADRIVGVRGNLGGDIFIHGSCVSIGCVAITDDFIEEVYLLASAASARGQRQVPVHIFPARLDGQGMAWLRQTYAKQPLLLERWADLEPAFSYFEKHRLLPAVSIDAKGRYRLGSSPAVRQLAVP